MAIIEKYAGKYDRRVEDTPYATFYINKTPNIYLNSACIAEWRKVGLQAKAIYDFENGVIKLIPVKDADTRNGYSVSPNGFGRGCRIAIPSVIRDQMPESGAKIPVTITDDGVATIRWDV